MLRVFLESANQSLKRANFDKMKCLLVNGIDKLYFEHNDIDCIWNSVEGAIKQSIIKSIPKKRVPKFKSLPWMNKDIRKMCTRKKLLYKRARVVIVKLHGNNLKSVVTR